MAQKPGFKIIFSYGVNALQQVEGGIIQKPYINCTIVDGKENVIAEGTVTRHINDKDDRVIGRKFAFKKALQNNLEGFENRPLRTTLWNQFRNECKQPELQLQYRIEKLARKMAKDLMTTEQVEKLPEAKEIKQKLEEVA